MGRMNIIIPVTSAMTVLLPGEGTDASEHDAFPDGLPTIHGFDEKIQLLPSLQRPKKIKIIGSDGREYIFLCKPKDDLRKVAIKFCLSAYIGYRTAGLWSSTP